jgi:hypothetical protein
MKTQNNLFIFILILTSSVVMSCQPKRNTIENEIAYTTINVDESFPLLDNPVNPRCELRLSFTYPSAYKDAEVLGKLQGLFLTSFLNDTCGVNCAPDTAIAQYVEHRKRDYKTLEEEFKDEVQRPGEDTPVRFFRHEMRSNEVVFNKGGLISFSVYAENYTGGAHSAHTFTNHVIDVARGTFITEDELFVAGFRDKLSQILITTIVARYELNDPKQLEEVGFFDISKIVPNGNFLIDATGITYSFNEYEIAAYSAGIINVHVPFDAIKDILLRSDFFLPLTAQILQ